MSAISQAEDARALARQLRIDVVRATSQANAGHPTSAASSAELIGVLGSGHFRYDIDDPGQPGNDRFVLSKGHASALLYAWLKSMGAIDDTELLSYGQPGSRLEGHPRPVLPWVDVATGSLGQGIAAAVGLALSIKRLEDSPARVFVLCGDGEMAEGSVWEAFEHAADLGLDNLIALVDVNGLGQSGYTMPRGDTTVYARRAEAFGWHAVQVDGHDVEQIDAALALAGSTGGKPLAVIAKTEKGRGLGAVTGPGFHGRPLADPAGALASLGESVQQSFAAQVPPVVARNEPRREQLVLPQYPVGELMTTRGAYGAALVALGDAREDIVVLDAETGNSTMTELFAAAHPDRFFEMYIAEQQMIATAVGLAARGWVPFASTFASFTTRAFEFVRMAAIGGAQVRLCGSHSGLSVGESGPSGMGLEDIACFRTIPGSAVLQPADANQAVALVALAADWPGIAYLRTTRGPLEVLSADGADLRIGGSRVLASSRRDAVTLIGSGVTVHAALAAAETLREDDINVRVIDCYSVKPIDAATVLAAAEQTGLVFTIEDHYVWGGLGSAVAELLAESGVPCTLRMLAVPAVPTSGPAAQLIALAGLDRDGIVAAVLKELGVSAALGDTG
jgi:transketolase